MHFAIWFLTQANEVSDNPKDLLNLPWSKSERRKKFSDIWEPVSYRKPWVTLRLSHKISFSVVCG